MKPRESVVAIARALHTLGTGVGEITLSRARLEALAAALDRALAVDVWEQPSWAEYRDRVLMTRDQRTEQSEVRDRVLTDPKVQVAVDTAED